MMNDFKTHIEAQKYRQIVALFEGRTFSWSQAVRIVGGRKRLESLMARNEVGYNKPFGAPNTKWNFDAQDILRNVKPKPEEVKVT